MAQSKARGGNLPIAGADHHSARLEVRPDARVATGLGQVEGLHEDRGKDLFDVVLPSCSPRCVLRSLYSVEEFRSRYGRK